LKIGDTVRRCDGSAGLGEVVNVLGDLVVVFIDGDHLPTPTNIWEVVEVEEEEEAKGLDKDKEEEGEKKEEGGEEEEEKAKEDGKKEDEAIVRLLDLKGLS
jgi:hypothetical protein